MASFEAVYGRPCHLPSHWLNTKDPIFVGPNLIEEIVKQVELIKKRIKEAQDRQKSYADLHRRIVKFEVGEHIFLKILPIRGVVRFDKYDKLSPRYVRPFEILKLEGGVAYQLSLPPILTLAHYVFYVSMFKKYVSIASY